MRDQSVWIAGPAGRLEGRFRPAPGRPRAAALLLHPHPLFGGTLHNKTLFRLAKRLSESLALPSLRFNFRGAGSSEGEHDHGRGEQDDARAALEWLRKRVGPLPIHAIGYSFGAAVGLRGLVDEAMVASRIALGLPVDMDFELDWFLRSRLPGLCVQGERDEYGDCARIRGFLAAASVPLELECVTGADHLFQGQEDEAVEAVVRYIARTLTPNHPS